MTTTQRPRAASPQASEGAPPDAAAAVARLLICWLLVGVYQGLNALIGAGYGVATWEPFVWEMSSVLIVLVLVPLVFRFEQRFRVDSRPRSRVILAHAGGLLVFSTVHTTAMILLRSWRTPRWASRTTPYDFGSLGLRFFYELQKDVILYSVILVVVFAMREFRVRRASELRAASSRRKSARRGYGSSRRRSSRTSCSTR